jgi:hypothetical protein
LSVCQPTPCLVPAPEANKCTAERPYSVPVGLENSSPRQEESMLRAEALDIRMCVECAWRFPTGRGNSGFCWPAGKRNGCHVCVGRVPRYWHAPTSRPQTQRGRSCARRWPVRAARRGARVLTRKSHFSQNVLEVARGGRVGASPQSSRSFLPGYKFSPSDNLETASRTTCTARIVWLDSAIP